MTGLFDDIEFVDEADSRVVDCGVVDVTVPGGVVVVSGVQNKQNLGHWTAAHEVYLKHISGP